MLVHVGPLFATNLAVRAFEFRRDAALVTEVTPQTFQHRITVPAFRALVVLSPVPSASNHRLVEQLGLLGFHRLPSRIRIAGPVIVVQYTIRMAH